MISGLPIPTWARAIRAEGWANIHDIIKDPPRLTGVDSFCGDVRAHTLIVGKDCAPTRVFHKRLSKGHSDPWSHDPKLTTNRTLSRMLAAIGVTAPVDGSSASTCGAYYANAHYLLRDDGAFSGTLPNAAAGLAASRPILEYILEELPLKRVIAMGEDAYRALSAIYGLETPWRIAVTQRMHQPVGGGLRVCTSSHLGRWGVINRAPGTTRDACLTLIEEDWRAMA